MPRPCINRKKHPCHIKRLFGYPPRRFVPLTTWLRASARTAREEIRHILMATGFVFRAHTPQSVPQGVNPPSIVPPTPTRKRRLVRHCLGWARSGFHNYICSATCGGHSSHWGISGAPAPVFTCTLVRRKSFTLTFLSVYGRKPLVLTFAAARIAPFPCTIIIRFVWHNLADW